MTSASTWPGPTEGSWSTSPTSSSAARSGSAFSSARISSTSTMLALVDHQQVAFERMLLAPLEAAVLGSVSSSRCSVVASSPVLSDSRLAARPVGRAQGQLARRLARNHRQERVDQRGLAHAGAAGDHQHLGSQRQPERLRLAVGQGKPRAAFHPRDRLGGVDRGPRRQRPGAKQRRRSAIDLLGPVQPGQEHARRPSSVSATTSPASSSSSQRRLDQARPTPRAA